MNGHSQAISMNTYNAMRNVKSNRVEKREDSSDGLTDVSSVSGAISCGQASETTLSLRAA